jgi:predicted regulator of Ras-like GTPase activity (Roadblock/LC7/MglB family)
MESILQRLAELSEIVNAILVGKDGLIVSGTVQNDDEEMLSAISAAAFDSIANYTTQANHGTLGHAIIETEKGMIQLAEVGELILVVTTNSIGNMGRVRLEMKKACHQISELVAAY